MKKGIIGGTVLNVKFIKANQDALFESYLPAIIAEALFQQIKQKELQANEDQSSICRSKPNGANRKNIGGHRSAGDAEPPT